MTHPPILTDILGQPNTLEWVLEHHAGPGRTALREAAELLRAAPRAVVTGMGASLAAARALRLPAVVEDAGEVLHHRRDLLRGAAVVLVSRSGETVEAVRLLPALREAGATIIGVTCEAGSSVARAADIPLAVPSLPDQIVAVQSYAGTLATLLLLEAAADGRLEERFRDAEAAARALRRDLPDLLDLSESWTHFLQDAASIHLLARGPSRASAAEGALLFSEIAKVPAAAATAGNFRHGSVESAGPQFHALVFAGTAPTRDLNLALARDLDSYGARVRVIGAGHPWPVPAVPESVLPIAEIAPVQLAAVRLALRRSIPLGVLRHVGPVVLSEAG
jgi:glucosamine--fructose-6-phosphate aminotransferase (isomerizing)